VLLLLAAWAYLCSLHWDNDGLWFQGDSSRHAANGIFWKDFLLSGSLDPKGYALSYYARYPVIQPVAYPPAFYLLEGAAFAVFGPSPYVAKGLVLAFALLAGLYTTAWLRRWVAAEAGWLGALVLLLPGMVRWSHAIMLNVPAFALTLGALYHARCWMDNPATFSSADDARGQSGNSRHLYYAAALGLLAVLTYYQAAVVVFIVVAWLVALRRWDLLRSPRALVLAALCALVVLPCALVAIRWAPMHVGFVTSPASRLAKVWSWTYYPTHLSELFHPYLIALAGSGIIAGILSRRWRRETLLLLVWLTVVYLFFSYILARESRYVLLLSTPLVCLVGILIFAVAEAVAGLCKLGPGAVKATALTAVTVLLAVQSWLAADVPVESVARFPDVVKVLEQVAPDEPMLYDGNYQGVFTFYLLADDPEYRRRVVRAPDLLAGLPARAPRLVAANTVGLLASSPAYGPLLGAAALPPGSDGPRQVLQAIQARSGCRWIVVEEGRPPAPGSTAAALRAVLRGPEFDLVRSFRVVAPGTGRVDVYHARIPVAPTEEVELSLVDMGTQAHYRIRPIPSRRKDIGGRP
jgi:hypothetical protein